MARPAAAPRPGGLGQRAGESTRLLLAAGQMVRVPVAFACPSSPLSRAYCATRVRIAALPIFGSASGKPDVSARRSFGAAKNGD